MLDKKPSELEFPFYVYSSSEQVDEDDLSFSYHVLINNDKNIAAAMCNDISCSICEFSCKEGKNRQEVLIEYAKKNFPEMMI